MECPLCYDKLSSLTLKACKHSFCHECAHEWFTRNTVATCPMCRGPFRFKGMQAWVDDKKNRDVIFEEAVNMILEENKVYSWVVFDNKMWGRRVSKIEKLKEFQIAYNKYDDDWIDDDDFENFVLYEDLTPFTEEEEFEYCDEPPKPWFTQYPYIF